MPDARAERPVAAAGHPARAVNAVRARTARPFCGDFSAIVRIMIEAHDSCRLGSASQNRAARGARPEVVEAMVKLHELFALSAAGAFLGPAIFCAIAAIYDGYGRHPHLLCRVLRSSGFVAAVVFVTLLGLDATEPETQPGLRWHGLSVLAATSLAFVLSLLPGLGVYLTVFHLSRRLRASGEPAAVVSDASSQETGNPYQPPRPLEGPG